MIEAKDRTILEQKLIKTILHLKKSEEDKKHYNASYNEEIKGAKSKIEAIANALHNDSVSELLEAFSAEEIDMMFHH